MRVKPLNWQKEGNSLYAEGVSCNYSIHPEHKKVRLFIVTRGKRPEVLDFDNYQEAMDYARCDIKTRLLKFIQLRDTNHSITQWFKTAKPNPTDKDLATQAGAMFEEMGELLRAFGIRDTKLEELSKKAYEAKSLIGILEQHIILVELLDAMCDVQVTMQGLAYMMGMDYNGALAEVNHSNWTKFEGRKALVNENGKIIKGENYIEPQLESFVCK